MIEIWRRFRLELRNPRKAALLVVLLGFAMLLWGRLLLEQVPRVASAEPDSVAQARHAGGAMTAAELDEQWADLTSLVEPGPPPVSMGLADRIKRDLFALRRDRFERIRKDEKSSAPEGKSLPEPVDEMSRLEAVRDAAAGLRLESIVTGNPPRAMINGRIVAPEQQINGFTLVRVAARFVLLEREGVTVRLDL